MCRSGPPGATRLDPGPMAVGASYTGSGMRRAAWICLASFALLGVVAGWNAANAIAVGMLIDAPTLRHEPSPPPGDVREVLEVERAGVKLRAWVFDPPG